NLTEVLAVLDCLGLPALPVAPAQPADKYPARDKQGKIKTDRDGNSLPAFTGKNPSFLDASGKPHLINHRLYQDRLPTAAERRKWFANPANGVGTLGDWSSIYWIDLDLKQFDSQAECDAAFTAILQRLLGETWTEQTHSGGYRIAVKLSEPPGFTNFALEPGGRHVGEVLGKGRFTVLAPTIGPSGNPYVRLSDADPVEVESLEAIGIYSTRKPKADRPAPAQPVRTAAESVGSIDLADLGTDTSRAMLAGEDLKGDRSESLVTAIQDWAGWANWCHENSVRRRGTVEDLTRAAGEALGIDADRVGRILSSVDLGSCRPAAEIKGGSESCWKKIRRLDQTTYKALCPKPLAEKIDQQSPASPTQGKWPCPDSVDGNLGTWKAQTFKNPSAELVDYWSDKAAKDPFVQGLEISGDEDNQTLTVEQFQPLADFDFTVERILESDDGGGLVLVVERALAGELTFTRAVIPSVATTKVADFVNALKKELKSNVCCLLKQDDLQRLLHVRTEDYRHKGGRTYRLIDRVGRQLDGTWVFEDRGEACQFKSDGSSTTEEESGWVWNSALGEVEKIPSPKIAEQNPTALSQLAAAAAEFFHPETLPLFYLNCGFVAANLHWQEVIDIEGRFPQLSNHGDPGGAKSTAVNAAMAVVGLHNKATQRFSDSLSFELAKSLSGLPVFLDDPIKKGMKAEERAQVDNYLWSLYNGAARKVRGNIQEPHTAAVTTSNVALGEGNNAIESRLLKLYFPVKDTNPKGMQRLRAAMDVASGGLGQLIAIGYPKAEIDNLEARIVEHLHNSHARIASNLALLTYYTQRFCDLAGVQFDALDYCLKHLCPAADDLGSDKDSLTDFIEKLEILRSQNQVGDWNLTETTDRDGNKFLAVYTLGVWSDFERQFAVNYSRQTIEKLAFERGAARGNAKFVDSKLTWTEHLRAKSTALANCGPEPPKPSKTTTRKALLIPYDLVAEIIDPENQPPKLPSEVKLPEKLPTEVTSEPQTNQGIEPQVTQVTQVTQEEWSPQKGDRVTSKADGLTGTVIDIEAGYFFSLELDEPLELDDGDTLHVVTRTRDQLEPADLGQALVQKYTQSLLLASQQNGHSKAALAQVVEEMRPLPQTVRQTVWDSLPKDLQSRIQTEIIGKPLKGKGVAS
ncbi:MAG: bifunctional DNA primase/polymerase, partial [Elainella sp.]